MDKNQDDTSKGDGPKDLANVPFITTGSMDLETETELIHADCYDLEEAKRLRAERQQHDEEPKDLAELARRLGPAGPGMHDVEFTDGNQVIQALVIDDDAPQADSRQTKPASAQNAQH